MLAARFEAVGDPSVLKVVEAPAPAVNEGTAGCGSWQRRSIRATSRMWRDHEADDIAAYSRAGLWSLPPTPG